MTPNDFNTGVIQEFRANDGKVGGPFQNSDMLLLRSKGAKSGEQRIAPLVYIKDGDSYVIVASKGGSPSNPDWYYNLKQHPVAEVEIGDQVVPVTARETPEEERSRLYADVVAKYPGFADYAKNTSRVIPVFALEPQTSR